MSFGDGQMIIVPEQIPVVMDPQLNIGRVEFKTFHTYSSHGKYILSYKEHARNEGIINMDESSLTTFYTETGITIGEGFCDSSPYLTIPPVDRACSGVAYYHNPGAVDLDDDSVSFGFVIPKKDQNADVTNYAFPDNAKFYTAGGINFNQGNENRDGPPGFVIDPIDGTVTWDAPGLIGEYAFAIKVTSWRFNAADSTWMESGFSIRDMQVIVEECANSKPDITVPEDLCVIAGTTIQFTMPASDPDGDPVIIEAFSEVLSFPDSPAEVTPEGNPLQSTLPPNDTAAMQFTWKTTCLQVKNQPYKIVFKVTDSPAAGPKLVRFKTVSVKVIAPPPQFENVTVNPVTKQVTLTWKDYACENVESIQVWRRVAQYDYDQPECNNGMPYFLRYTLLTTLPGNTKNYTDSDLAFGAQYCYRIVALTGDNRVASRISMDTCFIPKPAEAPLITNVTVLETHDSNGSIQVRWTSPFEIDESQYPQPYSYNVYRAVGFNTKEFIRVNESPLNDTVYTDTQINTQTLSYEYKVELFVPALTTAPVDTSSVSSSVFLEAESQRNKIKLTWEARTPWYNYLQAYPNHLIYRSESASGPFILIDSVDVNEYGFEYTDSGTFQNQDLVQDKIYYYKVLTRGSYGNPAVVEPLENLSQVTGASVLDSKPPCTPTLVLEKTDCGALDCSTDTYYNKLGWSFSDDACFEEALTYQIFVADGEEEEFVSLATVSENTFLHGDLNSMAKCYKVAAIDGAGNVSAQSEPVCNDNCPYFELPNVFTPGSEDGWNDEFSAFGSETGPSRCSRFVKEVDLKIYNRWGAEIYSIEGATPEENYIFWNGSSNSGKELDAGIYYYSAHVTFDVRDPAQQKKIIKGWVHLIRSH